MLRAIQTGMIALLLALAGCQNPASTALSDEDKQAINKSLQNFLQAAVAGNWELAVANYTSDAILMPPNHVAVEGREQIKAFFAALPPLQVMTAQNLEIFGRGDMAYIRGSYQMTLGADDAALLKDVGKFFEVRKKQADGTWLIYRDMFNSDLAAR